MHWKSSLRDLMAYSVSVSSILMNFCSAVTKSSRENSDIENSLKKKYQAVLAGKDLALMAKKTERQTALNKVIPDIVKCIKESDSLDDATATLVADRFYDEYVLDNLGHIRGKYIKYAPSVLSQVKISFGVFLSTKKAMDSIKKYIFREEVVCRDYPSLVRQVLASLFHTVLAPYKGVLI